MKMSKQELISHAVDTISDITEVELVAKLIEAGKITSKSQIEGWTPR